MAAISAALVLLAAGVEPKAAAGPSCEARPVVDEFVDALAAGDVERLEQVFAEKGEGWAWYSVSDRAGQRLRAESKRRASLAAYFASRIRQNEELRLVRFTEHANGNFTFLLRRRADDLHGGSRAVERLGKGWMRCETRKIGVWSLGGGPAPRSLGPCPSGALAIAETDLPAARRAVLRFARDTLSEMWPGVDLRAARITSASLAPGVPAGYTARVKCGQAVQRRTAVVWVTFPRVSPREGNPTVVFYASRLRSGWLVWRLVIPNP